MKLVQKNDGTRGGVSKVAMGLLALALVAATSQFAARTVLAGDRDLVWADAAGGSGPDLGLGSATLPDGSTVMAGRFQADVTFGVGGSYQEELTSAGSLDICVAQYLPDGTLAWARRGGGTEIDEGQGIAVLDDGSALVTGFFFSSATFDVGDGSTVTVPQTSASYDIFLAKYDLNGTLDWVTSAGGGDNDAGQGIATFADGSAVITGRFQDMATFGAGEVNQTILSSTGFRDIFVAKYDADGTLAWATSAGGSLDSDEGLGVSAAPDGTKGAVVTGYFQGEATFVGVDGVGTDTLSSAGSHDVFVAKYNLDGSLAWVTRAGGIGIDEGAGVAALEDGSALVSGYFQEEATFPVGDDSDVTLASAGLCDVFVAKYDADGTLAWAKRAGGESDDVSHGVAALSDGTGLVGGSFAGTATFGQGDPGQTTLTSAGQAGKYDVFVAKYDPDGALVWARRDGGTGDDEALAVSTASEGTASITGYFEGTATFGAGEVNETDLIAAGSIDIFVATIQAEPSSEPVLEVEVDINPGPGPNVINLGSHGVIPVAIMSSAEFDATEVDPGTVTLAGASVAIRGNGNNLMAHVEDVNDDGILDLVVQVETENMDPGTFQDGEAYVTGETYDGVTIGGWSELTIVPAG